MELSLFRYILSIISMGPFGLTPGSVLIIKPLRETSRNSRFFKIYKKNQGTMGDFSAFLDFLYLIRVKACFYKMAFFNKAIIKNVHDELFHKKCFCI